MSDKSENNKKPTSKSVLREIERIKKANAKRTEKAAELKKEIGADNIKLRELQKLYDSLCQEELQSRIAREWIRGKKMTDKQILKLLEVGSRIHDKIDDLDTGAVVEAVANAHSKRVKSND